MIELSIILVNWNCLAFTEQCVASIYSLTEDISFEVIVVDNASSDAPCHSLTSKYPSLRLILSEQNVGFGRANNLAVQHASGKYLFFLNPDTLIKGDAIARMLSALKAEPEAGAVGCRLLNPDESLQTTCVQSLPSISNQLLALQWLQRRWPTMPLWGKQALYHVGPQTVHQVEVVSGAAIMTRRDCFERVGGFNPEYFMFAEEVELCHAFRRAGWLILHVSDARILHFGGQSTKKCDDGFAATMMSESVFRFFVRTRGRAYALLYRFGMLLSASVRLVIVVSCILGAVVLNAQSAQQKLISTRCKWMRIARWCLGGDPLIAVPGSSKTADATRSESVLSVHREVIPADK